MHATVALATDRGVAAPPQPALLQVKRGDREGQQNNGQHGRPALVVLRAHHREENFGRQDIEIAAQHQGIAKVSHALDKAQQKGVRQPRSHQRPGDGAKGLPSIGVQGLCGLFQRGADGLHHPDQNQEGDWRERQQLRNQHAGEAVDPAGRLQAELPRHKLSHIARQAKQQNNRQADDKGRRDDRQQREGFEKSTKAHAGAGQHQGECQTQKRRQETHHDTQHQGIPGGTAVGAGTQATQPPYFVVAQAFKKWRQRPAASLGLERQHQHLHQWQADKQQGQGNHQPKRTSDKGIATHQAAQRHAAGQQKQKAHASQQRTTAHAELALLGLA